jgi:hypothetical protein
MVCEFETLHELAKGAAVLTVSISAAAPLGIHGPFRPDLLDENDFMAEPFQA